jgi:hypothetical protein
MYRQAPMYLLLQLVAMVLMLVLMLTAHRPAIPFIIMAQPSRLQLVEKQALPEPLKEASRPCRFESKLITDSHLAFLGLVDHMAAGEEGEIHCLDPLTV